MGGYRIKMQRMKDLIDGSVEAKDDAEAMLLIGYRRALLGDLLFNIITSLPVDLGDLNEDEKDMLNLGYALGQMSANEILTESFNNNNDDDGIVH